MSLFPASFRPVVAPLIAVAAVALLSGCTMSYEEAKGSSHRVEETGSNLFGREWSYYGPGGNELPLTEDCGDFFSYCVASPDGLVEFRYSLHKSRVIGKQITVNGAEWSADCVVSGLFGSYVCAPRDL